MSKKIPIGIAIILILVSVVVSAGVTVFVVLNNFSELFVDLPERTASYQKLEDVDELVRSEYFGKIDSESIDNALISGYLEGLDDSYCYYIPPDYFEDYNNFIEGNLPGIGLSLYYEPAQSVLVISSCASDSPAYEQGIRKGMKIISVDDKEINESNYLELIALLCNSYKGNVKFSCLMSEDADSASTDEFTFSLGYKDKSCHYSIDNEIGYINIDSFYKETVNEFSQAVAFMQENNVRSCILDLRNSSGANLEVAADIIDIIVPVGNEGSGSLYTAENEQGQVVARATSDSSSLNFDFAVLMNDRTECAAELVACDLRDFGKAVLIGEQTAGHGTLQQFFRLDDGGAVYLTVAEIRPYISDSFNGTGVSADIEILSSDSFKNQLGDYDFTDDEQYKAAYKYLSEE